MARDRRIERLLSPVGADAGRRPRSTRDWIVDLLALLLAAGIGALTVWTVLDSDLAEPMKVLDVAVGALLLVSLFWRRRYPVQLLLVSIALTPVSGASAGAALALLFTVAVHRPPGLAVGLAVLSLLPFPAFYLLHPSEEGFWSNAAFAVAFTAIVVAWGMFVRARRQLMQSLADRARDAEANQAERMARARDEERARIAREMHDVLGHRLSLLALHAGALEFRPDASADEVARTAGVIRTAAHDALTELRGAIGVLRGVEGDGGGPRPPQPTLRELDALLAECRGAGVRIDATVDVDVDAVPAALGRNAYRIVQEGLTNARKHAAGARVTVGLRGRPEGTLEIEVRNPLRVGVGAGIELPGAGTGLVGLRERAELAGGAVERAGAADGDWVLLARLPWAT